MHLKPITTYRSGYVYLIGSERFGWYKIGKSRKADVRVEQLGILLPFRVDVFAVWMTSNCDALEVALHEKYAWAHINGEWFCLSYDERRALIAEPLPMGGKLYRETGRILSSNVRCDVMKQYVQKRRRSEIHKAQGVAAASIFRDLLKQYWEETGWERTVANKKKIKAMAYERFRGLTQIEMP